MHVCTMGLDFTPAPSIGAVQYEQVARKRPAAAAAASARKAPPCEEAAPCTPPPKRKKDVVPAVPSTVETLDVCGDWTLFEDRMCCR